MGETVSYRSNGGSSEGYLARPTTGAGPGVVVIQEWWGLVPHIKSLADRFAKAGFVALAPDLYHGEQASEPDQAGKMMMGLAMDQAAKDIAGAADHLAGLKGTTDRVGAVGFCMGGSLALWSATLSPKIVATVGFYPPVPWERMSPTWSNYAGKAALIHCSEQDGTSAAPGIKTAVQAITQAGGECITYDYPGTDHAFFNDDRPEVYHASAAATAWARTLEFLRNRLG
jgi:carboxymethylenebutenolidase